MRRIPRKEEGKKKERERERGEKLSYTASITNARSSYTTFTVTLKRKNIFSPHTRAYANLHHQGFMVHRNFYSFHLFHLFNTGTMPVQVPVFKRWNKIKISLWNE
jgi:hypothetical protein